jgi:formamidopyrimidine-DNA glycosylase
MPERPDLEYVVPRLAEACIGQTVTAAVVRNPVVMRMMVAGGVGEVLPGKTISAVHRRAHFVDFELDGLRLVVSPMLAGRFLLCDSSKRKAKADALILTLSDGSELRYRDDVQMGKVYVCEVPDSIPGYANIGVDVLSRAFTLTVFKKLVKKRRDQIKLMLKDKSALDSMGNAYADEVLWEAKVHPKVRCNQLTDEQIKALHKAIVKVLRTATKTIAKREPALDEKLRDFLKVRNRKGKPCPRCGDTIRAAGVRGFDAFFCPTCQKQGGRGFIDWSRVKK